MYQNLATHLGGLFFSLIAYNADMHSQRTVEGSTNMLKLSHLTISFKPWDILM
jgi:hypothetical protein